MRSKLSITSLVILAVIVSGTSTAYGQSSYQSDDYGRHNVSTSHQVSSDSQLLGPDQVSKTSSLNYYIVSAPNDTATAHFEKNAFKLTHSPTVCTADEDNTDSTVKQNLSTATSYAVFDWSTKLNDGARNGPWHISYKKISFLDSVKFDPSCDIVIRFFNATSSDESYFAGIKSGGVTYYDSIQHKAYVKIFYDGMTPTQIQGVIEHELGHALGLGRYIIPESELVRISIGLEDSPSIMIGVVPNGNHFSITPLDVSEMKNKYGNDGFQNSESNQLSSETKQLIPHDEPISYSIINNSQDNLNASNSDQFFSQMIHDDVSDRLFSVGTGSVFVKDLIIGGYLKIPDSSDKSHFTYELPLSIRHHIVNSWASGNMTDTELLNALQYMINAGEIDLTKHFKIYDT